jgi:hypothetical protein
MNNEARLMTFSNQRHAITEKVYFRIVNMVWEQVTSDITVIMWTQILDQIREEF